MEQVFFWLGVTALQLVLAVQLSKLALTTILRLGRPSRPAPVRSESRAGMPVPLNAKSRR